MKFFKRMGVRGRIKEMISGVTLVTYENLSPYLAQKSYAELEDIYKALVLLNTRGVERLSEGETRDGFYESPNQSLLNSNNIYEISRHSSLLQRVLPYLELKESFTQLDFSAVMFDAKLEASQEAVEERLSPTN